MEPKRLFNGELRLLSIIWANEPVASGELVRLCMQELGWKKSTTYTVLKKLCEKQQKSRRVLRMNAVARRN